jgi:hypothetical protein
MSKKSPPSPWQSRSPSAALPELMMLEAASYSTITGVEAAGSLGKGKAVQKGKIVAFAQILRPARLDMTNSWIDRHVD